MKIILKKMRKYGIESSILTMVDMTRLNLVTTEKVKEAAEGNLKNEYRWKFYEGSINDDLEGFLTNLQNQEEVEDGVVWSFFTPKLTNEEMKLVEERNQEHLKTYERHYDSRNPDVDPEEMKKSASKSKYVHVQCRRRTMLLRIKKTIDAEINDEMEKKICSF